MTLSLHLARPRIGQLFLLGLVSPAAAAAQGAVEYAVIDLGAGAARAINAHDVVVGTEYVPGGNYFRPWVWDDGVRQPLPVPSGYMHAYATDVNDQGVVVGYAKAGWTGPSDIVRWTNGQPQVLPGINGRSAEARAVNNNGVIVGSADVGSFLPGAFIYDDVNGTQQIPVSSPAVDINDQGVVVGYGGTAWRWTQAGGQQSLGAPSGFAYSFASAVNESGQVSAMVERLGGDAETIARWDPASGWLVIGGTGNFTKTGGINADGDVVGSIQNATRAVLYRDQAGLRVLDDLTASSSGFNFNDALDINDRGNIAAGAPDHAILLVRLTGTQPLASVFCEGDSSCPCNNAGAPGTGCRNSVGVALGQPTGAMLLAEGSASVAADDLRFVGLRLPVGAAGVLFAGTAQQAGVPLRDGLLCVGGNIGRLAVRVAQDSGDGISGVAEWSSLAAVGGWGAGDVRHFQLWYRDGAGPCGAQANATNGLTVTFTP